MLQLHSVRKSYTTGSFTQTALDDVSIAFRDNEFVAVLGPSGSGKTTLLNIVGGLDHADSGSLEIDGIDTSEYKDRGLGHLPEQPDRSLFSRATTSFHTADRACECGACTHALGRRAARRQRATEALEQAGLGEHIHKRPNQLLRRADRTRGYCSLTFSLINDPEILASNTNRTK